MDLSKHPAPWRVVECAGQYAIADGSGMWVGIPTMDSRELLEQVCLWRNAEDALVRHGWSVNCHNGKFAAFETASMVFGGRTMMGSRSVMQDDVDGGFRADPVTAILDADRWWEANRAHPQEVQP